MTLINGHTYEEIRNKAGEQEKGTYEAFVKNELQKNKSFTLMFSSLDNIDLNQNKFNSNKTMLNIKQLNGRLNSTQKESTSSQKKFAAQSIGDMYPDLNRTKDSVYSQSLTSLNQSANPLIYETLPKHKKSVVVEKAKLQIENNLKQLSREKESKRYYKKEVVAYILEIHRKYSLSFACIVLFFHRCTLGSYCKKRRLWASSPFCHIHFYRVSNHLHDQSTDRKTVWPRIPFLARWMPFAYIITIWTTTDLSSYQ